MQSKGFEGHVVFRQQMMPKRHRPTIRLCCQKRLSSCKPLPENFINFLSKFRICKGYRVWTTLAVLWGFFACILPIRAAEYSFSFDKQSNLVMAEGLSPLLAQREIVQRNRLNQCEQLLFQSERHQDGLYIDLPVPASRVFDELKTSVSVRAVVHRVSMSLIIRFPGQVDPRTNQPLLMEYSGDRYTETGKWQELTCHTSDEEMSSRLIRFRSELANGLTPVELGGEMYVDRIRIRFDVPEGKSGIEIDDLRFGPIVSPTRKTQLREASPPKPSPLSIDKDRVYKNGQPFFPVFTVYHGESLDTVAKTGVNTLWIPDVNNRPLLIALRDMGIGAFAQPPPLDPQNIQQTSVEQVEFPEWMNQVWAWMLGVHIPPNELSYVSNWSSQVREMDRAQRRPILADVKSNERAYHRMISFLGSSQPSMQSDLNPSEYFERLRQRQNRALLGKPMFTFAQTEAASSLLDKRPAGSTLPVIEPEQILFQGYAGIAAGYKGIGFWKQISFADEAPGLNERILAIRLFGLHCKLLEPWLATGRIAGEVPVIVDGTEKRGSGLPISSRWDSVESDTQNAQPQKEIRATKIFSDQGVLILPVWFEDGAQCVPGPQASKGIRMAVSGCGEFATAWEVTPTSISQSNLELSRIAGGTEIHLKNFDRQAAILITNDKQAVADLQKLVTEIRGPAAETAVEMAALKLKRVQDVHQQLKEQAPQIANADLTLRSAEYWLEAAETELSKGHEHDAFLASRKCLQYVRLLQRAHWENATASLSSTTESLEALSFQTLPEHWKMMSDIAQRTASTNVLPSGDFEDARSLVNAGWLNASPETSAGSLQLRPHASGNYLALSLRRTAITHIDHSVLLSPEVSVQDGDVLIITGQVQIPAPLELPQHGVVICDVFSEQSRQSGDSDADASDTCSGVRFHEVTRGWKPFRMIRRVPADGFVHLKFELECAGTVHFDNVKISKLGQ